MIKNMKKSRSIMNAKDINLIDGFFNITDVTFLDKFIR